MHDLHFRALPAHLKPLADTFYRAQRSAMRTARQDRVWVAQQREIVAALCLRPMTPGYWLTSLFVAPAARRQGLGRQLIAQALAPIDEPVWLFCHPELSAFYRHQGFMPCTALPAALNERLSRYQRSKTLIALVRQRAIPAVT
ncbi:GNAT family N-acetyltransferase [Pseudomonas sp. UBA2684]|uniref:GNAT family N-acetyltransferase n=1 Tax=Pseudomonas sp. UBA2684 TaxID=1947311 RepID=UPI000E9A33BD|nr:GNAT family N-acetyltransferase [Pseudomonas sp. UBA2684]HBX56120.1 GNAT family N-acetyltransferase [Pseudomonas sp.]|tara:strand:- start:47151 stop:47579 length:429 start_codon:yes stop_codon:yes gene_type:complete